LREIPVWEKPSGSKNAVGATDPGRPKHGREASGAHPLMTGAAAPEEPYKLGLKFGCSAKNKIRTVYTV
jgi:hypothetical protein